MASQQKQRMLVPIMLVGIVLGGVVGYYAPSFMLAIDFIGQLFLNALKVVLLPLVVSTVIIGVALLGNFQKLGRAAVTTVLYFAGTTIVAVSLGVVLASALSPGLHSSQVGVFIPDMVTKARTTDIADLYLALIPSNLIKSIIEGQLLGLIVFSLFFGGALAVIGKRAKPVIDFFTVISEVSLKMVWLVMYAAPIGLFVLVGSAVAGNPKSLVALSGNFAWLGVTVLLGVLIHGVIILPLILKLGGHRSIFTYGRNVFRSLLTAVGTASSSATVPILYAEVVENNKVDQRASSMVIPLGATMNLNGTAMYLAIASLFIAQLFGLRLSVMDMIFIAALSTVISLGAGGVPGTSLFMLAILFGVAGFPLEAYAGIGLLVTVDWLFDRGRTVLNVWGNAVGAAVIGESFEFKTAKVTHRSTTPTRTTTSNRRYRTTESSYSKPKRTERKTKSSNGKHVDNKNRNGYSSERRSSRKTQSNERAKTTSAKPSAAKPYETRRKSSPVKPFEKKSQETKKEPASTSSGFAPLTPPPLPVVPGPSSTKEPAAQSVVPINAEIESMETSNNAPDTQNDMMQERAHLVSQVASMKQEEEIKKMNSPESLPEEHVSEAAFDSDTSDDNIEIAEPFGADSSNEEKQEIDTQPTYEDTLDSDIRSEDGIPDDDSNMDATPKQEQQESSIEYGRSRSRKGVQRGQQSSDEREPEVDEQVKAIDSFSTENITFGRRKRKRLK